MEKNIYFFISLLLVFIFPTIGVNANMYVNVLSDVQSSDTPLETYDTIPSIECARRCNNKNGCLSFFVYANFDNCRLYSKIFRPDDGTLRPRSGSSYYIVRCPDLASDYIDDGTTTISVINGVKTATVVCSNDYLFVGASAKVVCVDDGYWPELGQCLRKHWIDQAEPFLQSLPAPLYPGANITFDGLSSGRRFIVDVWAENDNIFNMKATNESWVNCDSKINGAWGSAEFHDNIEVFYNMGKSANFTCSLQTTDTHFRVFVNEEFLFDYAHRAPPSTVTSLGIYDGIYLNDVLMEL